MSEPKKRTAMVARCPWCNGRYLELEVAEQTFRVRCLDCDCCGPVTTGKWETAVEYWNGSSIHQNESSLICLNAKRDLGLIQNNRGELKMMTL